MSFLNLCDFVESKMSRKKGSSSENQPFLPTTVIRYEIPETTPGYPWMEVSHVMSFDFVFELKLC